MIDFRYHLVSLVAIFLALAVGIVLGAGPLQAGIGDSLTKEVTQLREDRDQWRGQAKSLDKLTSDQDRFEAQLAGEGVAGVAAGRTVALVALPDADTDTVEAVGAMLTRAGAALAPTVTLAPSWVATDDASVALRTVTAARLAPMLGVVSDGAAGASLNAILASALVGGPVGAGIEPARAAMTELDSSGLLDTTPAESVAANSVVVVAGPLSPESEADESTGDAWLDLAVALDTASGGAVVVADDSAATPDPQVSLVRLLRADTLAASRVSTVDNAARTIGQVSTAVALAEQARGVTGHYGSDQAASAPFAPLPAP